MYNYDNNYTVVNPINRYSLGSDDPLKYNADGTVTLYFQSASPGKDKESTGCRLRPPDAGTSTCAPMRPRSRRSNWLSIPTSTPRLGSSR